MPMMKRFLLCCLLAASSLHAQETMIRQVADPGTDTHVEVLALFSKPSPSGYFPVRVKIANNLPGERRVRLSFQSISRYPEEISTESEFGFAAPGQKTVTRDILVPLCPVAEHSMGAAVGVTMGGSFGMGSGSITLTTGADQPAVLMAESLYTTNASALDAEIVSHGSGSSTGRGEFAGKFDPKQLPDSWLAFSGYDAVMMTDADWAAVPPGGRTAILSAVRLGMQLVIYGSTAGTPSSIGLPADPGMGRIDLKPAPGGALDAAETVDLVTHGIKNKREAINHDYGMGWPLQMKFGDKAFRYVIFIVVLVLFGILVGPVNLFVFAKSGRRHRLFITTPAISLGASLILIALILFQDGFGGRGGRVVLMEVQPGEEHAAYIVQEQISRTGVLTGSVFTLEAPAYFSPVPIEASRWARYTNDYNGAQGAFDLQPDGSKEQASGDWFQSRSEQGHLLMAVTPTRGRIEATADPARFVSTFGHPIRKLFFLGEDGKWLRAEAIETGRPFTATPVDDSLAEPELTELRNLFSKRNARAFDRLKSRRGCFIAVTGDAPAIATHPGIRWEETTTIITGPVAKP